MRNAFSFAFGAVLSILLSSCATYKLQVDERFPSAKFPTIKPIAHSFYLIGDAGYSPTGGESEALAHFKRELSQAGENSTAIFLGDNIYPKGLPPKGEKGRANAQHQLNVQIGAAEHFKGHPIIIPGNHDWYSEGLKGLKRQENYVEERLGKNSFLPENGCPIEKMDISESIVLILIDSHWYMTNWDKHPTINDDCDINTRELFFEEYESMIKKARGKTTVVALHHPMFTNGSHGGQYPLRSHLSPLPVLGTLKNVLRKTGGVVNVDNQHVKYRELNKRLVALSQENENVVFVSGHDHNLQFIVEDNIPQIVSGSGSKTNATRNIGSGRFSLGAQGFARYDVFTDGSSFVRFYQAGVETPVYQSEVIPFRTTHTYLYPDDMPVTVSAQIYPVSATDKTRFYTRLWGERYRKYYSMPIEVKSIDLSTLYGGLSPVRKGGGHQSKSLRLRDADGREYVMRALKKNAEQFIQSTVFKDKYIKGKLADTFIDEFVSDIFTGAHPYAPLAVPILSDAAGILHTNPVLGWVPKQAALGLFNAEFGDELYMIEEHAGDNHGDKASFGFSNALISTHDMLLELRADEDHIIDEALYLRSRLFDMLIGDWDRHYDQWRWAKTRKGDKTVYLPMPRDRDQAFSKMDDGFMLSTAASTVPSFRLIQSFDHEMKDTKWFNLEPFPLDIALLEASTREMWLEQAEYLMKTITDPIIDEAFKVLPSEVQDDTIEDIKAKLRSRRSQLTTIALEYFAEVNRQVIIKGTEKDDWFDIERGANGTRVTGYRIQQGQKGEVFHQREYSPSDSKELWIYGLDDKDVFHVYGPGKAQIKVRIIGGQNNDSYDIENGKRVKVYDYRSKSNTFISRKGKRLLSDSYDLNVYDYKKPKFNSRMFLPAIGFNPDDGVSFGFRQTYTHNGFEQNPFTARHTFGASYYLATSGYDIMYNGEFAHVFGKGNLNVEARFTSPNFAVNFFGFGNETLNPNAEDEANFSQDYNRVKLETVRLAPSVVWRGEAGSMMKLGVGYESIEVEETEGRFINTFYLDDGESRKDDFLGGEFQYRFENRDNDDYPTLGLEAELTAGYKNNLTSDTDFGYINSSLAINHKLEPAGQLVFATKVGGLLTIGDGFEFYQAPSLGAHNGLRGYRFQRFTGKHAFYQSSDLRLNLRKAKTGILMFNVGLYAGFDYGRVWLENDNSERWNNSYGGGVFFNGAKMIVGNLSAFHGRDGLRFAFRLGFGF